MHPGMFSSVQHHRGSLSEALPANIANVWSFPDVSQQMDLLRAKATEGFSTDGTKIRLFTGMRSEMFRQAVFKFELHSALLANVFHFMQFRVTI